jgi:hypothetical protein
MYNPNIRNRQLTPEQDRGHLFSEIYRGRTDCEMAAYYKVTCDRIKYVKAGADGGQSYAQWFNYQLQRQ